LKLTKDGVCATTRESRAIVPNTVETIRFPFTSDFVKYLRITHWAATTATQETRLIYIGIAMMTNYGWRAGEAAYVGPYVNTPGMGKRPPTAEDHRYFLADLYFQDSTELWYSYVELISFLPVPDIILIRFTKDSSKTSRRQKICAPPAYLCRDGTLMEIELFDDFLVHIYTCGSPREDEMVFMKFENGARKMLTSKMVSTAMKEVAEAHGVPAQLYSCKSARKGLITNMTGAGHEDEVIQRVSTHSSRKSLDSYRVSLPHRSNENSDSRRQDEPEILYSGFGHAFSDPNQSSLRDLRSAVPLSLLQRAVLVSSSKVTESCGIAAPSSLELRSTTDKHSLLAFVGEVQPVSSGAVCTSKKVSPLGLIVLPSPVRLRANDDDEERSGSTSEAQGITGERFLSPDLEMR
jgi:hypothetical protein